MQRSDRSFLVVAVVGAAGALVVASPAAPDEAAPALVMSKEALAARYPELRADDIREGPVAGLYEVVVGGRVMYLTTDGQYLFQGEIFEVSSKRNLTEARRAQSRASLLERVDPATMIVFSPENGDVRHRITVFTDVDCGYCRQLHRQIALFNALGIEVRYLAYPRTGPNTESWHTAERVWCSDDRKSSLTRAKLGADVPAIAGCTTRDVAEQYELGRRIGVSATPAVFNEAGVQLGGYVPPDDMIRLLEEEVAVTTKAPAAAGD